MRCCQVEFGTKDYNSFTRNNRKETYFLLYQLDGKYVNKNRLDGILKF
jgi:hypothetical protein